MSVVVTREDIISSVRSALEPEADVLAMWLEGADAQGLVDPFSDIDLCCSVQPGAIEAVAARAQQALEGLGKLNLEMRTQHEENFLSNTFHFEDSEPFLLIDFDVYAGRGSSFTSGDMIERPLILFDRAGVITFTNPDRDRAQADNLERLPELEALRMRYTPLHADYYMVHISRHLPPEVLQRLEYCFQFNTLGELADKSREAVSFFEETAAVLKNTDGH